MELEDAVLGADVSRLPLESVPVNVWDEEDELPQDLSVADVRHLPFLKDHPDPQRRLAELFGEVVMFDEHGNPVTTKTIRPGMEEMQQCVVFCRFCLVVYMHCSGQRRSCDLMTPPTSSTMMWFPRRMLARQPRIQC